MAEVLFIYEGQIIIIQCNFEDKIKDIIKKFKNKIKIEDNNLCYIYDGNKINTELSFNQIAKENDKYENKINILVYNNKNKENEIENEIISNEIICPECKENILINIKDYKINLYECKNGHKLESISLNEYENMQKINLSKIICNDCYKYNKNNIYNEEFYICNECGINLCPLCKFKHNKNHNIINYNDKNSICKNHNDKYIKYCKECKENICFSCINEHNGHDIIELGNIIPNKQQLLTKMKFFGKIINKFRENIEEINIALNKVLFNIELYYKIFNNIINNYNNKNRNYQNYFNINEISNSTNNIISDLNNIINENNMNNKLNNILDIYYKIVRIKKTKIYDNGNKYIGEFLNDLKNGKGILYYNKKDKINRYEGDFKDDKRDGKGISYYNNGNRYEGDYKHGKKEGKGILYYTNGEKYEGNFKDGKKEGKGIFYFKNGDKYKGDFKDGQTEGKGVYYYKNGDKYKGDFKNGKSEGKGIYYYNNGERYEGDYKNDKREGKGIYYYNNGGRYEGDYKDDKREGKGIYYYNNGDREMGDYLNGKEIGMHVKLNAKGRVKKQIY